MKTLLISSVIILGGVAYFLLRKERSKNTVLKLKQKKVEKLTLHDVKEYFLQQKIGSTDNRRILLLVKENSKNDFGIIFERGVQYLVLTYYDENREEVQLENTLVIAAKELDSNLKDAFGDKEMLVLE